MIAVETAVARWVQSIRHNRAEATVETYRTVIHNWRQAMPTRLRDVDRHRICEWLDELLDRNRSPNTARVYYFIVRAFYDWASDRYEIPNVAAEIKTRLYPRTKNHQRVVTRDEYVALMARLKGQQRDMIQFIAHTGLRSIEVRRVRWSHIQRTYIQVLGKGDKFRLVPLNRTLTEIIDRYPRTGDRPAFLAYYAANKQRLVTCCHKAADMTRIERFGPHALRHYYATELMRRGVPLKKISMALGHSSTAITEMVYIHAQYEDIQDISLCLDE